MLNEYAVFIPINDLRRQLVSLKESDELAESNVGRAQQNLSSLTFDNIVQTRSNVEINSCEVNLAKISRIVHVCQYHVDVARCANSWNPRPLTLSP